LHRKGLVVGILILLILVNIGSSLAGEVDVKSVSSVVFDGNTLYVGGSGPNNYTKIQDAIDDASDGDTVFVYVRTYPYFENLIINKSIDLIGQDRNATLIDGGSHPDYDVINIHSDNVHISGFTTQEGRGINIHSDFSTISGNNIGPHPNYCGISLDGTGNVIKDNIISSNDDGVFLWVGGNYVINNTISSNGFLGLYVSGEDNLIIGNIISDHDGYGIHIETSNNNNISKNTISDCDTGIFLFGVDNNIVFGNTISPGNRVGIQLTPDAVHNVISRNIISHNTHGIVMFIFPLSYFDTPFTVIRNNDIHNNSQTGVSISYNRNTIVNNNFRNNGKNADFVRGILNTWDGNYWGEPQESPYVIKGKLFLFIPWFNFDWHPALEPYDIGV